MYEEYEKSNNSFSKEFKDQFREDWEKATNKLKGIDKEDEEENDENEIKLESVLIEKVSAFNNLIDVQGKCLTSNYLIGLYNGLILGRSVLTGEEPVFYEQMNNKEDNKNGES